MIQQIAKYFQGLIHMPIKKLFAKNNQFNNYNTRQSGYRVSGWITFVQSPWRNTWIWHFRYLITYRGYKHRYLYVFNTPKVFKYGNVIAHINTCIMLNKFLHSSLGKGEAIYRTFSFHGINIWEYLSKCTPTNVSYACFKKTTKCNLMENDFQYRLVT